MPTHENLPLISCWLERRFTENMSLIGSEELTEAEIFGVSSYPGREALFHARVKETGAVFSSLPIDSFRRKNEEINRKYVSKELIYDVCPDDNVSVVKFHALSRPARAWLRVESDTGRSMRSHKATYLCTLDWPQSNYLQHLVCLDQLQYALIPNHKIIFSSGKSLPSKYKKLRASFGHR